MKILIDNGHGIDTPSKCSPNRGFLEYRFNRGLMNESSQAFSIAG